MGDRNREIIENYDGVDTCFRKTNLGGGVMWKKWIFFGGCLSTAGQE